MFDMIGKPDCLLDGFLSYVYTGNSRTIRINSFPGDKLPKIRRNTKIIRSLSLRRHQPSDVV